MSGTWLKHMLKITRDGTTTEIPTEHGTISAALFGKQMKLRIYDKALQNTIVAKTMISNDTSYRGIPLDDLIQKSGYLETSYLLIYGQLPTAQQFNAYKQNILKHTYVHIDLRQQLETFRYNAHPTSILISLLAATSTLHPESNPALMGESLYKSGPRENKLDSFPLRAVEKNGDRSEAIRDFVRDKQVYRMVGKIGTLVAAVYRHRLGRPYNEPKSDANTYAENLLYMIDKLNEVDFKPDPILVEIIDKLFVLLAEDPSSCATAAMRHLTSSGVDPYSAVAGSIATLLGEHKGSNVYFWLKKNVKSQENIPSVVGALDTNKLPHGFTIQPTSIKTIWTKKLAKQVYDHLHEPGSESIYEISISLSNAIESKQIYLNQDYWTCILLHLLGFPSDMFPAIVAIPRVSGLMAHALESIDDPDYKIFRPRQIYVGYDLRSYPVAPEDVLSLKKRASAIELVGEHSNSNAARRRTAAFDHILLEDINTQIEETKNHITKLSHTLVETTGGKSGVFGNIFKKQEPITEEALKKTKSLAEKLAMAQDELGILMDNKRNLITQAAEEEHFADAMEINFSKK